MQFYTRLALLCLFAGVSMSALGQVTNAPTTSPTLTPEAEKRARQLLDSLGKGAPAAAPTLQEREAARKRAEAEAKQRLEEQKKAVPALAAPAAQPTVEGDREQRERELKRIEAEVEKARKGREPATTPQPAPRAPAAPASAPAAAEVPPLSNTLTPDAEVKARELLNQRTAEIKVNPPKPTVTAAPPIAPTPVRPPVATPAPAAPAPAVAVPTPVQPQVPTTVPAPVVAGPSPTPSAPATTPTLSAEQEATARDLINRSLGRPQAITPPAPATVAAPPVTAPAVVVTPPVTIPAPAPAVTTAPATVAVTPPVAVPTPLPAPSKPLTAEQEAAARAAVDQRMFEITGVRPGTVPPQTVKAPEAVAQPQSTPRTTTAPRTGQANAATTPAPAPPVVSAAAVTRAQKLSALLEAYKADLITPIEYHTRRAKILAEP